VDTMNLGGLMGMAAMAGMSAQLAPTKEIEQE
jgi:hypothetical protein